MGDRDPAAQLTERPVSVTSRAKKQSSNSFEIRHISVAHEGNENQPALEPLLVDENILCAQSIFSARNPERPLQNPAPGTSATKCPRR
jgi:hypothetical protein